MKQMTEAELKQLLEDAYQAGAEDQANHAADKESRADYVLHVMAEL